MHEALKRIICRYIYVDESIEYLLENRVTSFQTFDVVIASNLSEQSLFKLSNFLWGSIIPLIYCRSLEFHPYNKQKDSRLEYLDTTKITSKMPWLLFLRKSFEQYKSEHDGRFPNTYKGKLELREMIRKDMTADEEIYEEAIKALILPFFWLFLNFQQFLRICSIPLQ